MNFEDNATLQEEAEGEVRELMFAYHKKGVKYMQLWQIVHNLETEVTTQVIAEAYLNGKS